MNFCHEWKCNDDLIWDGDSAGSPYSFVVWPVGRRRRNSCNFQLFFHHHALWTTILSALSINGNLHTARMYCTLLLFAYRRMQQHSRNAKKELITFNNLYIALSVHEIPGTEGIDRRRRRILYRLQSVKHFINTCIIILISAVMITRIIHLCKFYHRHYRVIIIIDIIRSNYIEQANSSSQPGEDRQTQGNQYPICIFIII